MKAGGWRGPADSGAEDAEQGGAVLPLTNAKQKSAAAKGLRIATWNCFGLSLERMDYLFGSEGQPESGVFPAKGADWVVGLTECRGGEQRLGEFFATTRLVVSAAPPEWDKASGVALVLSPRTGRAVLDSGHRGSRIVWVQLETAVHGRDVIIVNVYVPHYGRPKPTADETFAELGALFDEFDSDPRKRRAVKIFMGDMNARLARSHDFTGGSRHKSDEHKLDVTGAWSVHHTDNDMGVKLRSFLMERELFSAGTKFRPRRKKGGAATYVPFGKSANRKAAGLDHMCISRSKLYCIVLRIRFLSNCVMISQ